jgi:hypothetical protein
MEEEARQILTVALNEKKATGQDLVESIRSKFAPLGFLDLPEIKRSPMRPPPNFDE